MPSQTEPIYVVSVNNTPQRAKELVAILIEQVRPEYNLVHVANSDSMEGVAPLLASLVVIPQLLICSSQWTSEQQIDVVETAKSLIPGVKTIKIPPGLNVKKGGEAVVDFLKEQVLELGLPKSG